MNIYRRKFSCGDLAAFDMDNVDAFLVWFRKELRNAAFLAGIVPLAEQLGQEKFLLLANICFQGLQNVYDHAIPRSAAREDWQKADHQLVVFAWNNEIRCIVRDKGVGIAIRQSGDPLTIVGPFENQRAVFRSAFLAGTNGSVKLWSNDCVVRGDPGYGFLAMADGAAKLGGNMVVRSGNCRATPVAKQTANGLVFDTAPDSLPFLSGTEIQIRFPHP